MVDAAMINVSPGQSIQAAMNAANPGDTIYVQGGVYRESLNITKPIILETNDHTLLDSGAMGSGITIRADGTADFGFRN